MSQQIKTIDQLHYNLDFSHAPLSKKGFDQVYTSRLLNRNLTARDEDLEDATFKHEITQQETALLQSNPVITNGLHFISLDATINGRRVPEKLRHKTAYWTLDRDYLSDTSIEQQHSAIFQSSSYLIPLVGIVAATGQKSSTLIISAIGYIGLGLGNRGSRRVYLSSSLCPRRY